MSDAADFSYSQEVTADDLLGRNSRTSRAQFVAEQLDKRSLYFLQDGPLSLLLFQEAAEAFVDARYIATVTLGFSFIERAIAGRLHNIEDVQDSNESGQKLLVIARAKNWLTDEELTTLTDLRLFRNSLVHFKDPLDLKRPEIQAILSASTTEQFLEKKARAILKAIGHVLNYTAL